MTTGREVSAGGVVYRGGGGTSGAVEFLMIFDAYYRWTIPKGTLEAGETAEEAALREIAEETGIRGVIEAPLGDVNYTYRDRHRGAIAKTVHFFLVRAEGGELAPQEGEVGGVAWVSPAEAAARCGYDNTLEILRRAAVRLGTTI
jgi:8-oxo-dGTP pyrophosphatase MutT (NUDIX family)